MVGDLKYPYQLTVTCYKHMKKPTRTVPITVNIILTHKKHIQERCNMGFHEPISKHSEDLSPCNRSIDEDSNKVRDISVNLIAKIHDNTQT